jgi:hypothetical protein
MKKDGSQAEAVEATDGGEGAAGHAGPQHQAQLKVDDKNVLCLYANFCRVNASMVMTVCCVPER